jgi:hypothetical protein
MKRSMSWLGLAAIVLVLAANASAVAQTKAPAKKPSATGQAKPAPQKPAAAPKSPVQAFLDSKALQGAYNGVVIDYLLAEGKPKLSEAQHKQALDQLVAALKEKVGVTQNEQLTAALGNLVGVLMGAAGGDTLGEAGADVQRSYAGDWASWVDAAEKLFEAGYQEDAVAFFQFGMVNIPYDSLRARCIVGLARARPEEAYTILADALKKPQPELKNEALRMMGHLAAAEWVPAAQKDAIIKALIDHSQGMMNNQYYQAVIYGLDVAHDQRAIPALSRFRKGITTDPLDRRAALKSLILTYKDESVVGDLTKLLKAGFTSTNKPEDRFFAGVVLMEAGRKEGFDWALAEFKPKKKGFFSSSKEEMDLRPDLVTELVRIGGEQSAKVLADSIAFYKDGEWLKTWMAIALLELGDTSQVALAKAALGTPNWEFTAVRVSTALAKNNDYSGIPVLQSMAQRTTPPATPGNLLNILGGAASTQADKQRLSNLRRQVATALGEINQADCVPVLIKMLADSDLWVRSNAAFALAEMSLPAALAGMKVAMTTDYGTYNEASRNPGIWAYVLRSAVARFPKEPATREVLAAGAASPYPSVKFMALVAQQ